MEELKGIVKVVSKLLIDSLLFPRVLAWSSDVEIKKVIDAGRYFIFSPGINII